MTNAIVCPKCKHENPEDSIYCNSCGFLLTGDMDSKLKHYETRIEAAAEHAETETYERIIKWAKQSTWAIGIALTILGITASVGAYLGIGTIHDFNEKFKGYDNHIDESMKKVDEARAKIDEQLKKIELEKKNFDQISEKQLDIQRKIEKYNTLFNKAMKQANQFFDLTVQINNGMPDKDEIIKKISDRLIGNGFIVDPVKILRVHVDATEVIYYSKYSEEKAKEVAEDVKLALGIKTMRVKYIKSSELNRYVILVKISNR